MRVRVAGVLILNDKLLLVKHCKDNREYWLLPGGGVELGESMKDALIREFDEEVGMKVHAEELIFVVETISPERFHVIQPVFRLSFMGKRELWHTRDKRVCGFSFFNSTELKGLTIYPDINDELVALLEKKRKIKKYIFREWLK